MAIHVFYRVESGMFSSVFCGLVQVPSRTDCLGSFSHVVSRAHCLCWGLLSSPRFVGCGAQFRFGPLLISNLLAELPCFGTVDYCSHSLCVCGYWSTLVLGCS